MGSKRRRKTISKELICARCESKLDSDQIYCLECGEPTSIFKNNLSALKTIRRVWDEYKESKDKHFAFAIFYFFALLLPLGIIIIYTRTDYYLHNLILLFFLPLLFIPFSIRIDKGKNKLTIGRYFANLKHYPRYLSFVFLNIVYFFLLKVITTSVDPILNLVRFIMVLYWISIVVPLPCFIADKKENIIKAWLSVYKGGKETRWQQFYIYIVLGILNMIGAFLLGVGLLITIPFSIAAIEEYYHEMDRNKLFATKR